MRLYKIEIENFRSIKNLEISLDPVDGTTAFTIFGINETGKSNILKAISLLSKDTKFDYAKDCEKTAYRASENVSIDAYYKLEDDKFLSETIAKANLPPELSKSIKISEVRKNITFDSKGGREDAYWLYFGNLNYDKYAYIENADKTRKIILKSEKYDGEIKDLDADALDLYLYETLTPSLDTKHPKVLFWASSKKYLITEPVNLNEFKSSFDVSVPLRNIFALADYLKQADVKKAIELGEKSIEERQFLEESLSVAATKHVNTLWPEHHINIKVRIESNNECTVFVEDKDNSKQRFSMEQRSDGFKHFISILLTLSAENITEQLKNVIILLDEPENSLHPSSIRYLKDELLSIGGSNIVVTASHSIFMVDKKNLGRHFTASKDNGSTVLVRVDPENPFTEEVVYEALGTSIYEVLEPNLIVFEGRTDKELFDYFSQKYKSKIKPPKIKSISATGVEQIPKYIKFFSGKLVKGFIAVDSDSAGRDCITNIVSDLPLMKDRCFHPKQFVDTLPDNATLEDMFPHELIVSVASTTYETDFALDPTKPIIEQIKKSKAARNIHKDHKLETLKRNILLRIIEEAKKLKHDEYVNKFPLFSKYLERLCSAIKAI